MPLPGVSFDHDAFSEDASIVALLLTDRLKPVIGHESSGGVKKALAAGHCLKPLIA